MLFIVVHPRHGYIPISVNYIGLHAETVLYVSQLFAFIQVNEIPNSILPLRKFRTWLFTEKFELHSDCKF